MNRKEARRRACFMAGQFLRIDLESVGFSEWLDEDPETEGGTRAYEMISQEMEAIIQDLLDKGKSDHSDPEKAK